MQSSIISLFFVLPLVILTLATFCTQSTSQRYIETVKNLEDTWRALEDQPPLPEHTDRAVIETTFRLDLTVNKHFNNREDFSASLDVSSHETASRIVQSTTSSPRHFRTFPDYGTGFIWLNDNDPACNGETSHIELKDQLIGLPKEVVDNYDAWVETYTTNFKTICDDPGE